MPAIVSVKLVPLLLTSECFLTVGSSSTLAISSSTFDFPYLIRTPLFKASKCLFLFPTTVHLFSTLLIAVSLTSDLIFARFIVYTLNQTQAYDVYPIPVQDGMMIFFFLHGTIAPAIFGYFVCVRTGELMIILIISYEYRNPKSWC